MTDVKYDAELCERLIAELRAEAARSPYAAHRAVMADQLAAARAEVERLRPVLDFATAMLAAGDVSEFAVWKYKLGDAIDAYRAARDKVGR